MSTNESEILPCIEIEPSSPAKRSIILLHGLGADGSDFVPIISELKLTEMGIRFIFPHAPVMPITINNGYEMRAWFDIPSLSFSGQIDEAGIAKSTAALHQLIHREETRGITSQNIILAGFSQGAVIALSTGLRFSKPLAGILALSGLLPNASKIIQEATEANRHVPIFIAHGTEDPIVPYAFGKATYVALQQAGYPISWHSYAMPHSVCAAEINDISQWIQTIWR